MSAFLERKDRKVIPRWRHSSTTAAIGELASAGTPGFAIAPGRIDKQVEDWERNRTAWHAADLVSAAFVQGLREPAVEAAQFLVREDASLPPSAWRLARRLLEGPEPLSGDLTDPAVVPDAAARQEIRGLKSRLRDDPRNAIAWTDLSRYHLTQGHPEKAASAIRIALALSPTNRFVLRAAARFFVHQGDLDRARRILVDSEATQYDPWLVAAEISVSAANGTKPRFAKVGRQLLAGRSFRCFDTTELASALATLELEHGNARLAKKLFHQALETPTENSVAQAEWASNLISGINLDVSSYEVPRNFEARAWHGQETGDWPTALRNAQQWQADQEFSSRPAMMGSYIASVIFENYVLARQIANRGRAANPDEPTLLNNLAFASASAGDLSEAQLWLKHALSTGQPTVALTATHGLVCFRAGLIEEGRALYLKAIESAGHGTKQRALAALFLAREEILSSTAFAGQALERAEEECNRRSSDSDIALLLERFTKMLRQGSRETDCRS
jgi:tetratricopeptide (TPR) repeat protein